MNVGNALKVTCVGFAGGVLLRAIQMLYCFDYDTGFYTDGGLMALFSLAVPVVAAVLAGAMCFRSRRYFGPYVPRKNNTLGVAGVVSGLALIASAVLQGADYASYLKTGFSSYDSTQRSVIHLAFLAACLLFGAVQLWVSVGFFQGRNNLEKVPLLYLVAVLWGIAYLILVYVFYAKSSSMVENAFAVGGSACTLLSLFYLCKLFAGVEEESAAKRVFVVGILAVVLTVTHSVTDLALLLLGRSYSGEIPAMFQLCSLSVSAFVLIFLFTFKKYSLRRTPRSATGEIPRVHTGEVPRIHTGEIPRMEQEAPEKEQKGRRFRPN